jgi:hypothetical protein
MRLAFCIYLANACLWTAVVGLATGDPIWASVTFLAVMLLSRFVYGLTVCAARQ